MIFETTIWDVEHGSAAIAVCPNGKAIMLDAGCSDSFSPALHLRNMGYGPRRPLDELIVSHPDQDHINDLPRVFEYLRPRILVRNSSIPASLIYRGPGGAPETEAKRIYNHMHRNYVHPLGAEDLVSPAANWGGVEKWLYYVDASRHPNLSGGGSCNNFSVVTVLTYGALTVIFPGDIEDAGMQVLLSETDIVARATAAPFRVLVAPHHGREAGVSADFLGAIRPSLTIMSDVRGAETTDRDTYVSHSRGLNVIPSGETTASFAKVVTTKSNSAIHLSATADELVVRLR